MSSHVRQLCEAPAGHPEVLQGNIAFAVGCVRAGIHCADGYPGTPSSEVIDKGLSEVQDLIKVGWSVNEAVASGVGVGHSIAGSDSVVTMKIPGLFQAADIFTSGSVWGHERGALVYYVASDFTPSSTQHLIDPRYLFKSCFVPVFEPRDHQEMHLAAGIAADVSRTYRTQVVVMPSGVLCHSEGLVRMMAPESREPLAMEAQLKAFNVLPNLTRGYYDAIMDTRLPALEEMVETTPLNRWTKGSGRRGVVTYGVCDMFLREVMEARGLDLDVLSLAFSNPLPRRLLKAFHASIDGDVFVLEDGYRFVQEAMEQMGLPVQGKEPHSRVTEWSPALIAERLGLPAAPPAPATAPALKRPPVICPGCPYRLFADEVATLRRRKQLDAAFGDIGCNSLLYFMNAMDTGVAMGASEAKRIGYVVSRPEKAGRCISIIGDSTECHSGLDATRNAVYRNVPGVKVILDNEWTAMTGGQPSPTSPANLAGQSMGFDLPATLAAHGAKVAVIGAYDRKAIKATLKAALAEAEQGVYTTIVLRDGPCLRRTKPSTQRVAVDPAACKKCNLCLICPGIALGAEGIPTNTNLCSGCGGHTPSCSQMCPTAVLKPVDLKDVAQSSQARFPQPPALPASLPSVQGPERLSVAIRGVGGQGNLFFGKVLTQVALLAGYEAHNIVKGETHGMAQMGGPVISTFGCGTVKSPVLLPGTADALIVMEKSEVLRPGFLDMLRPGGTVVLANTRIVPFGLAEKDYPADAQIHAALEGCKVIEVDVLARALELGDPTGRVANVVMMGVLSTLPPFDAFPEAVWLSALQKLNPKPAVWASNYAAFRAGRG